MCDTRGWLRPGRTILVSFQNKESAFWNLGESVKVFAMGAQQCFDVGGGAIAALDPDDFRWRDEDKAALMKIGILGDNDKITLPSKAPDFRIIGPLEPHVFYVPGVGLTWLAQIAATT